MSHINPSLIRLVAGRYGELQGLQRVVDAVSLLCLWSLLSIGPVNRSPVPFVGAMTVWACLTFWSAGRVARFYRERFGRTTGARTPATMNASHLSVSVIWMTMVFGGVFIPILTVYAAYVAWRDRPFRTHWLLIALAGAVFTCAFAGLHSPEQFQEWHSRFVWTAAPVLALVGLLDDRVLRRAMRAAPDSADAVDHADTV